MCTATGSPLSCCLAWQERQGALELAHASLHLLETFHHLLELRVLLEEPVHVGDLRAAALGDAGAPAPVDNRGLLALIGCHGADDRLEALEVLLLALELLGQALGPFEHRDHLHDLAEGPHGAKLLELGGEVLEGEALLANLARHLLGLGGIDAGLSLFNEGEYVAHSKDPL